MMSFRQNQDLMAQCVKMPYGAMQAYPVPPPVTALPALPTGVPTGPAVTGPVPGAVPWVAPPGEQAPQTVLSILYTPGYLRTQIGKLMRVEFLIGTTGPLIDRIGTLKSVGASYILLQPVGSDDLLLCDIYSIKFVTILL